MPICRDSRVKDATNLPFIEPCTTAGRKEVSAILAREQMVPASCVIGENLQARSVERDQSRFSELGIADRENAFRPVDVCAPQIECLADA